MESTLNYFALTSFILIILVTQSHEKVLQPSTQSPPSVAEPTQRTNFYQECKKTSDCPDNYCCVIGMMRYQPPSCQKIGRLDDPCHPHGDNLRRNFTLHFPNNSVKQIDESWTLMCPCDKIQGFFCSKTTATCVKR